MTLKQFWHGMITNHGVWNGRTRNADLHISREIVVDEESGWRVTKVVCKCGVELVTDYMDQPLMGFKP